MFDMHLKNSYGSVKEERNRRRTPARFKIPRRMADLDLMKTRQQQPDGRSNAGNLAAWLLASMLAPA
jgi:hypothetical protein